MKNKTKKTIYILRKLKSRRGETIVELLIAIMIGLFSILMLGQVISTSAKLDKDSRQTMDAYYEKSNELAENLAKDSGENALRGTVSIIFDNNSTINVKVNYYKNSQIGNSDVIAYKTIVKDAEDKK